MWELAASSRDTSICSGSDITPRSWSFVSFGVIATIAVSAGNLETPRSRVLGVEILWPSLCLPVSRLDLRDLVRISNPGSSASSSRRSWSSVTDSRSSSNDIILLGARNEGAESFRRIWARSCERLDERPCVTSSGSPAFRIDSKIFDRSVHITSIFSLSSGAHRSILCSMT